MTDRVPPSHPAAGGGEPPPPPMTRNDDAAAAPTAPAPPPSTTAAAPPPSPTALIRVRSPEGDLPTYIPVMSPEDTVADIRDRICSAWPRGGGGDTPLAAAPPPPPPASPGALVLISSGRVLSSPGAPFLATAVPPALRGPAGAFPTLVTLHVVVRREGGGASGKGGGGGSGRKGGDVGPAGGAPPPPQRQRPSPPRSESLGTADTATPTTSTSAMATSSNDGTYEAGSQTTDVETTSGDGSMSEGEAAAAAEAAADAAADAEGGGGARADRARAADLAAAMLVAAAAAGGVGALMEAEGGGGGDDGDGDDGGDDDGDGLLGGLAPGAATDDSGDEAAAIKQHRHSHHSAAAPPPTRTSPRQAAAAVSPPPLPPTTATSPGDGAGEAGRGSYVAGPATLHASAVAASSHFQAADAVAAGPAADLGGALTPVPGEEDVVLVDRFTVSVWRLPPVPGAERARPPPRGAGASAAAHPPAAPATSAAAASPPPRLLARALYTQVEPYTVARSPDGLTVALGGDLGVVALLRLEACPGLPACALCGRAARRGQVAPADGEGGAGGGGAAAPPPAITTLPSHLRPTAVAALGGALAAVANNNMVNGLRFGRVAGRPMLVAAVQDRYVYYLDPAGAGPEGLTGGGRGGGGGGGGGARRPGSGGGGGGASRADALAIPSLGDAALPFPPPPPPAAAAAVAPAPLPTSSHRTRALDAYAATADGSGIVPAGGTRTAVSGPFPRPVNLALPSPDGRCVAVVGDFPAAYVLRAGGPAPYTAREAAVGPGAEGEGGSGGGHNDRHHHHHRPSSRRPAPPGSGALRLAFGVDAPPRLRTHPGAGGAGGPPGAVDRAPGVTVEVGAQYAAWSPDSSLLAATSDALRAAFVWHVPRGQALLRVEAAGRPVLAATFLPGHPATLAFAEAARRAYAADLRHVPAGLAKLPPVAVVGGDGAAALVPLPRVAGLAATPGGRLLAATRAGLAEWRLLPQAWDPTAGGGAGRGGGASRPPAFRAAARTFLLIAALPPHRRPHLGGGFPAGPWSLPGDLVDDVLTLASSPLGAWIGVGAPPRPAPPAVPVLLAPPGGATYAAVAAMGMERARSGGV